MDLFSFILLIALSGFIVWLILQIPMPAVFRNVIIAVVVVFMILWILQMLGVSIPLPELRLK